MAPSLSLPMMRSSCAVTRLSSGNSIYITEAIWFSAGRLPALRAILQRNLLYTGVTRGKRLVVLVGQKKAVAVAVRTSRAGGVGRSWRNGSARTSRSVT
jgi:hypothetical protein